MKNSTIVTTSRTGLWIGLILAMTCSVTPHALAANECDPQVVSRRDIAFTVVWGSSTPATGHLRVGTTSGDLTTEVCDVRDGTIGCPGVFDTHFIQVTGLSPSSEYFIQRYEDGAPVGPELAVSTGPPLAPSVPNPAFGVLFRPDGSTYATGSYACATIEDADGSGTAGTSTPECDLIELPGDLGFWAVNLNNARTSDLSARFDYSTGGGDSVIVEACGGLEGSVSMATDTASDDPAADLVMKAIAVPATSRLLLFVLGLLLLTGLAALPRPSGEC